uniref:Uncharacterized protein n=1 Tax=Percolomonas cosmopolitus TaxID=63605 RepID=A0A7S1KS84_9EUKA|mmetsp:Transcript_6969/g.26055  ORF Transcript_6969/g.26055 Transcript_6969/m.26055 type:complete len:548 (+) Transcript_6969:254-1897(+)|eukprot:CAMPEP_0117444274 /NCGR_PEP_ID=MMETSP0759-20121206/5152_1 /TAXON_ID=63605 /ORGANISM="Percolomonas cosmopolitus, Strain WS" /LENGTH=547 /DNA_ID=CAMNT_0005236327 /DNA_START=208 /DNA_END=1851 /DNA_ORIENTATION=-
MSRHLASTLETLANLELVQGINEVLSATSENLDSILSQPHHLRTLLKVRLLFLESELSDMYDGLTQTEEDTIHMYILSKTVLRTLVRDLENCISLFNRVGAEITNPHAYSSCERAKDQLITFQGEIKACLSARDERTSVHKLAQAMRIRIPAQRRMTSFFRREVIGDDDIPSDEDVPPPEHSAQGPSPRHIHTPPPVDDNSTRRSRSPHRATATTARPGMQADSNVIPSSPNRRDIFDLPPPPTYEDRTVVPPTQPGPEFTRSTSDFLQTTDLLEQEASKYDQRFQQTIDKLNEDDRILSRMHPRGASPTPPPDVNEASPVSKRSRGSSEDTLQKHREEKPQITSKKRGRTQTSDSPNIQSDSEEREEQEQSRPKKRRKFRYRRWTRKEEDYLIDQFRRCRGHFYDIPWSNIAHEGEASGRLHERANTPVAVRDKCRTMIMGKKICDLCFERLGNEAGERIDCSNTRCKKAGSICKPKGPCKASAHRACAIKRDGRRMNKETFLCNHCKGEESDSDSSSGLRVRGRVREDESPFDDEYENRSSDNEE